MSGKKDDTFSASGKPCFVKEICPSEAWDLLCSRSEGKNRSNPDSGTHQLAILDVRTPQEFSSGHLKGAVNLDYRSPRFKEEISCLERGKAYLIYCRTGIRAGRAVLVMSGLGFRELYHIAGGIDRWHKEGFEVVKLKAGSKESWIDK